MIYFDCAVAYARYCLFYDDGMEFPVTAGLQYPFDSKGIRSHGIFVLQGSPKGKQMIRTVLRYLVLAIPG